MLSAKSPKMERASSSDVACPLTPMTPVAKRLTTVVTSSPLVLLVMVVPTETDGMGLAFLRIAEAVDLSFLSTEVAALAEFFFANAIGFSSPSLLAS